MIFKSIRFKIILWYMLVLAVTLSLFSVAVYDRFSRRLYGDIDDLLGSRCEGIVDAIDMFWERQQAQSGAAAPVTVSAREVPAGPFVKIAQQWVDEESAKPHLLDIMVRIFDVQGFNIVSSPGAGGVRTLAPDLLESVGKGARHFQNHSIFISPTQSITVRTLTFPVIKDGALAYIVQVSGNLAPVHTALVDLRLILFVLLPLTIIVTGVAGAFLAKKALHPVMGMIATTRRITARSLKLRLTPPDTRDEIKQLADTFNEMLERLDTALSSQQRLVQDMSHEFKTPLTILKGQFEVALKRSRTPQEYTAVLTSGIEEIDRLNRIVEDLMMLAQFDTHNVLISPRPFDLAACAARVVETMRVLADQKGVALAFASDGAVEAAADENYIRRAVLNLLSNAVKFTPARGRVDVRVFRSGKDACVAVKDTGPGIPVEERERVFERFYSLDRSPHSHGLGLSIVKSVVEAHGGRIEVESAVGAGSTFTIILPCGATAAH